MAFDPDKIVAEFGITIPPNDEKVTTFEELRMILKDEADFLTRCRSTLHAEASRLSSTLASPAEVYGQNGFRNRVSEVKNPLSRSPLRRGSAQREFINGLPDANQAGAYALLAKTLEGSVQRDADFMEGIVRAINFKVPPTEGLVTYTELFRKNMDDAGRTSDELRGLLAEFRHDCSAATEAANRASSDMRDHWQAEFEKAKAEFDATSVEGTESAAQRSAKQLADAEQQLSQLLETYRAQIKLKEPSKYWKEMEERYVRSGRWAMAGASALVLVFFACGLLMIYNPPGIWNSEAIEAKTIKSAILLAVIVSSVAYLLHLLVRISLSGYHLACDARERYQLTIVYLALVAESEITDKEREIVFGALFSRSDSGLLKHDGSPTVVTPWSGLIDALKGR